MDFSPSPFAVVKTTAHLLARNIRALLLIALPATLLTRHIILIRQVWPDVALRFAYPLAASSLLVLLTVSFAVIVSYRLMLDTVERIHRPFSAVVTESAGMALRRCWFVVPALALSGWLVQRSFFGATVITYLLCFFLPAFGADRQPLRASFRAALVVARRHSPAILINTVLLVGMQVLIMQLRIYGNRMAFTAFPGHAVALTLADCAVSALLLTVVWAVSVALYARLRYGPDTRRNDVNAAQAAEVFE